MSRRSSSRTTRREFVGALLGAASLAATGCGGSTRPHAESPPRRGPNRKLGVALLGLGGYSESQLGPALKLTQHCELRGIVTGSPGKVDAWRREYNLPQSAVYDYDTLPRIADNRDIDVVYVVTPTALHAKYSILSARAGKHVWCEKPMAMTVQECQSIIDACRNSQVSLSIGYRMHHEPNTQTVMRFARERPFGAIRKVRAVASYRSEGDPGWRMDPQMGGGALYDMGVYSVNALRYATAEEPVRVTRARQWSERPELYRDVDESSEFELEFPSGVVGSGKASLNQRENVLRIDAERGFYELAPMQAYSGVQGRTSDGRTLPPAPEDQQARQMDADALAILEHRAPIAPGEEGLRDVRIIQAIIEAARTSKPVPLQ